MIAGLGFQDFGVSGIPGFGAGFRAPLSGYGRGLSGLLSLFISLSATPLASASLSSAPLPCIRV